MHVLSVFDLFIRASPAFPVPQPGLQPAGPTAPTSYLLIVAIPSLHQLIPFHPHFLGRSPPILQMLSKRSQKLLLICFLFLTASDLPPTALHLPLRSGRLHFLPCTVIPALPMPLLLAIKPAHLKEQALCVEQSGFTCSS